MFTEFWGTGETQMMLGLLYVSFISRVQVLLSFFVSDFDDLIQCVSSVIFSAFVVGSY